MRNDIHKFISNISLLIFSTTFSTNNTKVSSVFSLSVLVFLNASFIRFDISLKLSTISSSLASLSFFSLMNKFNQITLQRLLSNHSIIIKIV